jgi:propionate CoA-transferase
VRSKIVTADEAIALIRDGDTLSSTGFVQIGFAEALLSAVERRFVATGTPRNLTLFAGAGQGDGKELGLNHLGHEGLLKRVVAGHWAMMPKVGKLALDNKIQAYNLPQGIICQLFRDLSGGKPGTFSKVGLHTFVDPRYGGGRVNDVTTKDIVDLVEIHGEEWLFYHVGRVNVAFIRGSTADTFGNITMEREALTLNNLAMAMAAKNSNGIVIAQVERIAERGSLPPRQVKVPGILVDCIVVAGRRSIGRRSPPSTTRPMLANSAPRAQAWCRLPSTFSSPELSLSQGSSTPRDPSPDRRPSSPISLATPTASRSRIRVSLRSTRRASPSNGRTIGSKAAIGSRP